MDPRRHLIPQSPLRRRAARLLGLACAGLLLSGCGTVRIWLALAPEAAPAGTVTPVSAAPSAATIEIAPPPAVSAAQIPSPAAPRPLATMAPIPNPPEPPAQGAPGLASTRPAPPQGRAAIAAANRDARTMSRAEAFTGGVQVFDYDPGQVFEVWTAPLRVTTLTLAPGETIVSKAAGDTVRWQIGETTSGEGAAQRTHVMLKPQQKGLETNLVIATSRRVYQLLLRSGPPESFNTVVTWKLEDAPPPQASVTTDAAAHSSVAASALRASAPSEAVAASPAGALDGRYRIAARGKAPTWAPTAVMTDGVRTFLAFPPTLEHGESPALFVRGADGEVQLVNYRQQSGLWVVDRVVEQGELRLGDRPRDVVLFVRLGGRS